MRIKLFAIAAILFMFAGQAHAATTSLFDFKERLSVGARAYRSFDEKPSLAGSYTSGWWGGLSLAHEITSPHDPSVRVPISIIGAFDLGIPAGSQKETLRGYIGVGFLLKKAGY